MISKVARARNQRYESVIRSQNHDTIRAVLHEAPQGEAELLMWARAASGRLQGDRPVVMSIVLEESRLIGYSDREYWLFLDHIREFIIVDGTGRVVLEFVRRNPPRPGLWSIPSMRGLPLEQSLWVKALINNFNDFVLSGAKVFRRIGSESQIVDCVESKWRNIVPALREGVLVDDADGRCTALSTLLNKFAATDIRLSRTYTMLLTWFSDLPAKRLLSDARKFMETRASDKRLIRANPVRVVE